MVFCFGFVANVDTRQTPVEWLIFTSRPLKALPDRSHIHPFIPIHASAHPVASTVHTLTTASESGVGFSILPKETSTCDLKSWVKTLMSNYKSTAHTWFNHIKEAEPPTFQSVVCAAFEPLPFHHGTSIETSSSVPFGYFLV